ncbi:MULTISPECIES: response regulator [Marichromatium]|uniref:Response regulator receiver domain-containing protein n=1 Tax=Marichromatium gracile TaxID=1048 RepID=A0A4R4ABZ9_MARGR|nr:MULTISPECIES: response regulator [Marichromatium]MBO8086969.1 response regulator [Marichromatium sp.]MBK1710335.1 response regulator [Marichromatium gracile]RNE89325.1 response regulator [Marichromatium sp. AB31]RNE92303.1 response regulator [Marichromatium sp. AB32]TCW36354.1 response regulator receiver domain-containing protein [Marichromatium gracile]
MHILIVDDDTLTGELTAAILEQAGHRCEIVAHGLAALERIAAATSPFDCVISDLHMPLLDGLELEGEIRKLGVSIPFILLSGDDLRATSDQRPGISAHLCKDETLEEALLQAVARL